MGDVFQIFTDGGSRGNPGKSACAFAAYYGDKLIHKDSRYLGITTNNRAEYEGLLMSLTWLYNNLKDYKNVSNINIFMDSELVVRQLNGKYKIKDKNLLALALQFYELKNKIKAEINITSVLRNKNKIADALVNECLDGQY